MLIGYIFEEIFCDKLRSLFCCFSFLHCVLIALNQSEYHASRRRNTKTSSLLLTIKKKYRKVAQETRVLLPRLPWQHKDSHANYFLAIEILVICLQEEVQSRGLWPMDLMSFGYQMLRFHLMLHWLLRFQKMFYYHLP
jgi:hypothetical protein